MLTLPKFAKVSLLKSFVLHEVTKILLRDNSLPVLTYAANMWRVLEVDENIIAQIFNKNFANEMNTNYSSSRICRGHCGHYTNIEGKAMEPHIDILHPSLCFCPFFICVN